MGLDFGKLQAVERVEVAQLRGKRVAIDVPNLAYPFFLVRTEQGAGVDEAAAWAMHGVVARVFQLAVNGARSVLVLDGPAHPLKRATLEERQKQREARGAPALTGAHYALLEPVASALGVPIVRAPHDAEAQGAWLSQAGHVDVVATTDWDAIVMGADEVLRGLSSQQVEKWTRATWFDVSHELDAHLRDVLAAAAVLMGSDYGPGLRGVGPKKALKIARDCGGDLSKAPGPLPDGWRETFFALADPDVDVDSAPTWSRPRHDAAQLLEELGGKDRSWYRTAVAQLSILHDPPAATTSTTSTRAAAPAQVSLGRFAA